MTYQHIVYEKQDGIARITLNRPEKLNALSAALQDELTAAVTEAEDDDAVHCVVIKANGRAFSSGYDLTGSGAAGGSGEYQPPNIRKEISGLLKTQARWGKLWDVSKPVIAQVHGYCLAGGAELVAHCDFVICAEDAQFGYPPVRMMGGSPTHMWTYLVGPQWSKYFLLTGNSIDGKTAEHIGLAWKAVPAAQLEAEVEALAATFAKIPTDLLAANKSICNKAIDMMGRAMVNQMAAEIDAISHQAPAAIEFRRVARSRGIKAALALRDAPFKDYGRR